MRRVLLRPFGLAALQILGVLGERRELTLDRRTLEQLLAPLELAAQLLLRFGQTLQRLPCGFRIETRERLLQLAQPLLELRREGALQQLLHFAQPILERAVIQAGRLRGTRDLLYGLRQLLDALRHRSLIARDLFGALRRLERHRALLLLVAPPRAHSCPPVGITVPFLGKIPRSIAQLSLGGGDRLGRARHCLCGGPRLCTELFHAGKPQRDLGAAPDVRRWGVVERFDVEPQRIAGQEAAVLGVEPPLHDRAITHAGDIERLAHRFADAAGATHAPAHNRQARDPMIITHIGDELLMQRNRQRRVASWHRYGDDGCGIGHDQDLQLGRGAFQRRAVTAPRLKSPCAADRRHKAALDARSGYAQRLDARCERPGGARERHTRRAAGEHRRPRGQRNHVAADQQRLVGAAQI